MDDVFFALWFFLPAGIANVMPVFAAKIPWIKNWDAPVDFGLKFRGKPILGAHKTIRGIVLGTLSGTIVFWLQTGTGKNIGGLDYNDLSIWLGVALSFGALFGDMAKSFFKRQFNVASGKSWFPFDQLDYIVGGLLFSSIIVILSLNQYLLIMIAWFGIHIISSYIGYLLKFKKDPI